MSDNLRVSLRGFWRVGNEELRKYAYEHRLVRLSVYSYVTTREPLHGYSQNLTLRGIIKMCR
jgi:hypothetical protein